MNSILALRFLRFVPPAVGLLAVAAIAWVLVSRPSDDARWVHVEVPTHVAGGGRMRVTLTLNPPRPSGFLRIDLHWKDGRSESHGFLSTSGAQFIRPGEIVYHFDLPVPARPALVSVFGVIYVTPTGRWADRNLTCTFESVAVSPKFDPAKSGQRRLIAAREMSLAPPSERHDSRAVRWVSAVLWSLAGMLSWRMCLLLCSTTPGFGHRLATRWAWLALACFVAAGWESSAVEAGLGDLLRRIAMAHGLYNERRRLQEVLTIIVIAVSFFFAVAALRRDHAQPVSLVFSGADAYAGISAVSFISLHDADAWLATPVFTIPVVQALKLASVIVALCGAARATLSER